MYKPGDKVQFNLLHGNHKFEKTILLVEKGCIYFTDNSKINFLLIMKIPMYIVKI